MPKLYSSKYVIKVLEREGFIFVSQKGSHRKFKKPGKRPFKEIPMGTLKSILRQANLTIEDFKKSNKK